MKLDPRHLRTVLAVVEHGSFNRAAEAMGVSQPAFSKSISLLERSIGAKVFERGARGSTLTAVGHVVARRAENLNQLLLRLDEEIEEAQQHREGPLIIGATPSLMLGLVPEALARLIEARPDISARIVEGLDDRMTSALSRGEIDLLVGPVKGLFPPLPEFVETEIAEDPYYVTLAPSHPLASVPALHLSDLKDERWILPNSGSTFYRGVEALFLAAGIPWPRNPLITNSLQMHARLIARAGYIGIATRAQLLTDDAMITAVPLADVPPRSIGVRRRALSFETPLSGEFLDHLRAASRDLGLNPPPGEGR